MNIYPTHESYQARQTHQRYTPLPPHRHNSENLAIEREELLNRTVINPPTPPSERRYIVIGGMTHDELNSFFENIITHYSDNPFHNHH